MSRRSVQAQFHGVEAAVGSSQCDILQGHTFFFCLSTKSHSPTGYMYNPYRVTSPLEHLDRAISIISPSLSDEPIGSDVACRTHRRLQNTLHSWAGEREPKAISSRPSPKTSHTAHQNNAMISKQLYVRVLITLVLPPLPRCPRRDILILGSTIWLQPVQY